MFQCNEIPWKLYIGKDFSVTNCIKADLESSISKMFDFIRVPLVHPRYSKHQNIFRSQPTTRSDSCLNSHQWRACIQGKCNEKINPDHLNLEVRKKWEQSMNNELGWGAHLGVNAIILKGYYPSNNFSRILNQFFQKNMFYSKILIQVSLSDWKIWDQIRLKCGNSEYLGVSLGIDTTCDQKTMERWIGEPVCSLYFPRSIFIKDKNNNPILTKKLTIFIQKIFKQNPNVIIGPCRDYDQVKDYIYFLYKTQPAVIFK